MFFLTLLMALLSLQPLQATKPVPTHLGLSHEAIQSNASELPAQSGSVAQIPAEEIPTIGSKQDDMAPAAEPNKPEEPKTDQIQQKAADTAHAQPAAADQAVKQEAIGIIRILGKIHETEEVINKIIEFGHDSNVKGILLVVDCGGGAIGSSEILFREIKELSCQKPVVTLVINTCCSGAYWVSIASNWIVAQSSSTIGAIGVKFAIEKCKNFKQTDQGHSADLDITVLCAGKFKGASDERTAPMNDEERAFMQEYVDQQYEIFTSFVAQARNLLLEKVSDWAEGKNFTGAQALKLGLIDQIGGYSDAVKKLEQLIHDRGIVVTQKLTFVE